MKGSAMQRDEDPNAWHLTIAKNLGYYLLELELVSEGELEGEVLAVEIDLALVEDFGETEGVAGVDHKVTIFVRQADGEGEIEGLHRVAEIHLDIICLDR